MIDEYVAIWDEHKSEVEEVFLTKHPDGYRDIVAAVVQMLANHLNDYGDVPNPKTIHTINDGDYQGTLLFLIPMDTYQPNKYLYVKVYYGSCSGCDTLQAIRQYDDDPPTDKQIGDYMTLALHILQGLKEI